MRTTIQILAFIFTTQLYSQVGIGTLTPDSSSVLELSSTSKGFLPPRLTLSQRNSVSSPVAGLTIWCIDCGIFGQLQVFNGNHWTNLIGGAPEGLVIGDNFGGGKVAYILKLGNPGYIAGEIHGIIAATADHETSMEWGCPGTEITGADGVSLGTGNQNTLDIVFGCADVGAAKICFDFISGGYTDWYLPSILELKKLEISKETLGGFNSGYYWSSSEYSVENVWVVDFFFGDQVNNLKSNSQNIRAVRSF